MTTVCLLSSQTCKEENNQKTSKYIEKLKKIATFFLHFLRLLRYTQAIHLFLVFAPVKNLSCNVYRPPLCPKAKISSTKESIRSRLVTLFNMHVQLVCKVASFSCVYTNVAGLWFFVFKTTFKPFFEEKNWGKKQESSQNREKNQKKVKISIPLRVLENYS